MKDLTVYHNPKYRKLWLILGVALFLLGILGLVFFNDEFWGANMGLSIFYLFVGFYSYYKPHLSIKNNVLWVSAAPFRRTHLKDIQEIRQFLDETTFISKGKETLISTQVMSEEDKEKFLNYVEEMKSNLSCTAIAEKVVA